MASDGDLVIMESRPAATPPPIAAEPPRPTPPAAVPAVRSPLSRYARLAFLALAALTSAAWFLEPFASAAGGLRLPRPVVVATVVLLAALFYASVRLFWSFFLLSRSPPAATAAVQWEGAGAIAVAVIVASVGVAVAAAACLVAAGGSAYGYAPARS